MSEFVFGVDLDGVCADYEAGFRAAVARMRGIDPATLESPTGYNFEDWGFANHAEFLVAHGTAVGKYRMFATLPAVPGCTEALWKLSNAGVWIRVITHRLHVDGGHATAVADTVTWLDAHDIPYRDICFLGAKSEVGAHVYVDDAPHNIEELRAAGNHAIIMDKAYNRHLGGERAHDWDELAEMVLAVKAVAGDGNHQKLSLAPLGS